MKWTVRLSIIEASTGEWELMPFRCPQCLAKDSLKIRAAIELPPGRRSFENTLQVVACTACEFSALALYQEFRDNVPEAESWRHIGYRVSPDAVESVLAAIHSCPTPLEAGCQCPAHRSLVNQDLDGAWRGLLELEHGRTFAMRLAADR